MSQDWKCSSKPVCCSLSSQQVSEPFSRTAVPHCWRTFSSSLCMSIYSGDSVKHEAWAGHAGWVLCLLYIPNNFMDIGKHCVSVQSENLKCVQKLCQKNARSERSRAFFCVGEVSFQFYLYFHRYSIGLVTPSLWRKRQPGPKLGWSHQSHCIWTIF